MTRNVPELVRHLPLRPLLRKEYDRLIAEGAFENERIELLYGVLVEMSPIGGLHVTIVRRLNMLLVPLFVGRAEVQVQCPVALSDDSEPEPDIAVVPTGIRAEELPTTAFLVVEVSDSSLRQDRLVKAPLYASAGIPEYWIVDVQARRLERYRAPRDGVYTLSTIHEIGETMALVAFPDITIAIAQIFPA